MYEIIVNEHGGSGKAKKTWEVAEKILKEKNIEYRKYVTELDYGATAIAKDITSKGEDVNLLVLGGDGTINEVLNGIQNFEKTKFGIIPTGSGNDFARGLGIPKNTKKALDIIFNADGTKKIDLGCVKTELCERRIFGISSGLGMDAMVCKKALSSKLKDALNKLHLGKFIYGIYTLQTLFSMFNDDFTISFDGEEEILFNKLIFSAFMNCFAEGGGVPMAPDAKSDDGKLSVCVAYGIPKITAFFNFLKLTSGKHTNTKGFYLRDFTKAVIKCAHPATLHLDGEYGNEVQDVTVEVMPSVLTLLM